MSDYSEAVRKLRLAQNHMETVWKSSLDLGDAEYMLENIIDDIMDIIDVLKDIDNKDFWAGSPDRYADEA